MVDFFPRSLKNDLKRKNSLRELKVNYMEDMKKYIKYMFINVENAIEGLLSQ